MLLFGWMLRPLCAIFLNLSLVFGLSAGTTLRIMSFNVWRGGAAGGQPLSQTVKAIRESKAGVVGMQESFLHEARSIVRQK